MWPSSWIFIDAPLGRRRRVWSPPLPDDRTAGFGASGLHELDVEVELDLLGDEHAAAVEGHVPLEAPVLAVDLALGGETGAGAAPRVAADAVELQLQLDGPGDALDGEVAVEHE